MRWDLAHELASNIEQKRSIGIDTRDSLRHDLEWEVMLEAMKYAAETKDKRFYFMPETYYESDRQMFRNMNWTLMTGRMNGRDIYEGWKKHFKYVPIKTYYTDPMRALLSRNGSWFEECIKWLVQDNGRYFDAICISNFDDESLADIIPDNALREEFNELIYWLGKAKFNVLSYVRDDTGIEDINPVSGGRYENGAWQTHKFTSQKDLSARLENRLDELLAKTKIYETMKQSQGVERTSFKDGVVTFNLTDKTQKKFVSEG